MKPYPSCRYGHAALDGILALAREHGIKAEEVEEVTVGLPEPGWKLIGDPEPAKQSPKSVVDGQFSMAFVRVGGAAHRRLRLGRLRAPSRRPGDTRVVQEGEGAGGSAGPRPTSPRR